MLDRLDVGSGGAILTAICTLLSPRGNVHGSISSCPPGYYDCARLRRPAGEVRPGECSASRHGIFALPYSSVYVSRLRDIAGSPTLFTGSRHGGVPVSEEEIAWALNLADMGLISMTLAWVQASRDDWRKHGARGSDTASGQTPLCCRSESYGLSVRLPLRLA